MQKRAVLQEDSTDGDALLIKMDCFFLFSERHHKLLHIFMGKIFIRIRRQTDKLRDDNSCMQQIGYPSGNKKKKTGKKYIEILRILAMQ